MKIEHLSVSRSQLWNECKQKYKFKYHLGVKSNFKEKPYFTYGKAVHRIIEIYTEEKGKRNIGEIAKKVMNGEILLEEHSDPVNLERTLPKSYRERLKPELTNFLKLNKKLGFLGEAEWGFHFGLDPNDDSKYLKGIIDRLIIKNEKYIIIDYKTTKKGSPFRKNKNNVIKDLQLQCYARVIMEYFKADPKNIKCALYYLPDGEIVGASFTEKTLMSVEQKMLEVYNNIHECNPDTVTGNVGNHCTRCEYNDICPFYNKLAAIFNG